MKLPLTHALLAAGVFIPFALVGQPVAGAVAGVAYYLGREGAEAQYADPRPKSEDWMVPFLPWTWPRQMILDAGVPAAVSAALVAAYFVLFGG
jgi:hypothetical protein